MKNTKEEIMEVVGAALDQKPIQMENPHLTGGSWIDMVHCALCFNFTDHKYRVKPQPREWWEIERKDHSDFMGPRIRYKRRTDALRDLDLWVDQCEAREHQVTHVKEVID